MMLDFLQPEVGLAADSTAHCGELAVQSKIMYTCARLKVMLEFSFSAGDLLASGNSFFNLKRGAGASTNM